MKINKWYRKELTLIYMESTLSNLLVKNIKFILGTNNSKCYNFLESVLRIIDIDTNNLKKEEVNKNVNIFRRKVGNDLIQNNLYKILPNNVKYKKNSIHLKLINNDVCDENIYKYISYYLELNILIIKDNLYRFVNDYDNMINTIILVESSATKFIPIYLLYKGNLCNIFDSNIIENIINNFELNNRIILNNKTCITDDEIKLINKYKNYKLSELQEICKVYDINIYSDTKYKKKIELFEEFKNKIINDIKLI